jgi:hypothetical protein
MAKKIDFHNEFINQKANLLKARDTVTKKWVSLTEGDKKTWSDNSIYKSKKDDGSASFLDYFLRLFAPKNKNTLLNTMTFNLGDAAYDKRTKATWAVT